MSLVHIIKKITSTLAFRASISIVIILYLISIPDWSVLINLDTHAYVTLAFTVTLTYVSLMFMSLRWQTLIKARTHLTMDFKSAYVGYLRGLFYNIFMPSAIGGDLYRIKYCKDYCSIDLKQAGIIIATERTFGIFALLTFLFIGIGLGGSDILTSNIEKPRLVLLFIALVVIMTIFLMAWRRLQLTAPIVMKLYALSLMSQGTYLFAAMLILNIIVSDAENYWVLIAMPLAFIATVLPISIGGLGVREGVLVSIFLLLGVNIEGAIIVSILAHLINVVAGALGFTLLSLYKNKSNESL
jgi:uncharacterized membrane protein YbhN (UPF0104 family)